MTSHVTMRKTIIEYQFMQSAYKNSRAIFEPRRRYLRQIGRHKQDKDAYLTGRGLIVSVYTSTQTRVLRVFTMILPKKQSTVMVRKVPDIDPYPYASSTKIQIRQFSHTTINSIGLVPNLLASRYQKISSLVPA